jgi:Cu-Zn family superoxide dismutase
MLKTGSIFVTIAGLMLVGACAPKQETAAPESEAPVETEVEVIEEVALVASATLQPRSGGTTTGTITFTETADGVSIHARVEGAPAGMHGFHIHEVGDCSSEDFKSAGGHFNPAGAPHGGPTDAERHGGDLGNIEIGEDGIGHLEVSSEQLTVAEGENSVVGRGVILHEGEDDLETQPTGAAGARLACGVVTLEAAE